MRYAANEDIGNLRLGDPLGCGLVLIVRSARRFTARTFVLQLPEPRSWRSAMTGLGQLRPRRQSRLNDRSRFSGETFAGAYVNGREAPIPAIRDDTSKESV